MGESEVQVMDGAMPYTRLTILQCLLIRPRRVLQHGHVTTYDAHRTVPLRRVAAHMQA